MGMMFDIVGFTPLVKRASPPAAPQAGGSASQAWAQFQQSIASSLNPKVTFALAVEFNRRRWLEMSYGGLSGAELDPERSRVFPRIAEIWEGYPAAQPGPTRGKPLAPAFAIEPLLAAERWIGAMQDQVDAEFASSGYLRTYWAVGFVNLSEPWLLLLPSRFKPTRPASGGPPMPVR